MRHTARVRGLGITMALALVALAGCGEDDFANKPRPPVPLQLTGVITDQRVTISPRKVGAGPVVITVSNQSGAERTLTLDGEGVREQVGPINPLATEKLQKTLKPGRYTVRAGSPRATKRELAAATLVIGKERPSGSDRVLLP